MEVWAATIIKSAYGQKKITGTLEGGKRLQWEPKKKENHYSALKFWTKNATEGGLWFFPREKEGERGKRKKRGDCKEAVSLGSKHREKKGNEQRREKRGGKVIGVAKENLVVAPNSQK